MPHTVPLRRSASSVYYLAFSSSVLSRLLLFGTVLLAAAGCSPDIDTSTTEEVESVTAPAPKPAPLSVNLFLELSGGMRGFMPVNTTATEPTAFQNRVSQLASRTRSSPAVADAQFLLTLKQTPTATTYQHFRDVVQGDTREAALGTELPEMLESILAQPKATNKVNVVISDFVYGPENKAKTGQINVLTTDALVPVTKNHLAVAVMGETSAFRGTFHPAVKKPRVQVQLNGEKLPYYIWIIGPSAAVGRYVNEVMPAPTAQTQQAYFGLSFSRVPYAAVLTQVPPSSPLFPKGDGSIYYDAAGVSPNLKVSDVKQGIDFAVALNLNQLPAAWREPIFLNQNLKVELPGGSASLITNSVKPLSGVSSLAGYTHTVRVRLSDLPKTGGRLTLSLPAPEVPAWVAQWSTTNDNLPGSTPRTYRLIEIISGLREALPPQLPPVFQVSFSVANDD